MPYTIRYACPRCHGRCFLPAEVAHPLRDLPGAERRSTLLGMDRPFVCSACTRAWDLDQVAPVPPQGDG